MRCIYNLGICALGLAIHLAALFNHKARLWVRGRRGLFRRLEQALAHDPLLRRSVQPDTKETADTRGCRGRLIWFHAASLGEFEQGRPLIEKFRAHHPQDRILLTFYSPSGYEVRKDYPGADYIFYLPADTPRNVRRFLRLVQPDMAIFIKYEFWVNYLSELHKGRVRTFIISAIFRPDQSFFRLGGGVFRNALATFEHIFVQNSSSQTLLASIGITRVSVTGDTRFDRVYDIALAAPVLPDMERFSGGNPILVAGSTWPSDEKLLVELIREHPHVKFIIAPHELDSDRIDRLMADAGCSALRYTRLTAHSDLEGAQLLVMDTIGWLSSAYRYARWSYIGGGFTASGIHNVLEAATFGTPLCFGPNYSQFQEAVELIEAGGAAWVNTYAELKAWLEGWQADPLAYQRAAKACSYYVQSHTGATEAIYRQIEFPQEL